MRREDFWSNVKVGSPDECWEWQRGRADTGYGRATIDGVAVFAHRHAYTVTKGAIPEGMFICHHCDNRVCVNPSHLFVGTQQDNMRDKVSKGRANPACGEENGKTYLAEALVLTMRQMYADGMKVVDISRTCDVKAATTYDIVARPHRSWRFVGGAPKPERKPKIKPEPKRRRGRRQNLMPAVYPTPKPSELTEKQIADIRHYYDRGLKIAVLADVYDVAVSDLQALLEA